MCVHCFRPKRLEGETMSYRIALGVAKQRRECILFFVEIKKYYLLCYFNFLLNFSSSRTPKKYG